ncbi:hypothetical protein ACUV84_027723 [Puccinellia chinampoensis]
MTSRPPARPSCSDLAAGAPLCVSRPRISPSLHRTWTPVSLTPTPAPPLPALNSIQLQSAACARGPFVLAADHRIHMGEVAVDGTGAKDLSWSGVGKESLSVHGRTCGEV